MLNVQNDYWEILGFGVEYHFFSRFFTTYDLLYDLRDHFFSRIDNNENYNQLTFPKRFINSGGPVKKS